MISDDIDFMSRTTTIRNFSNVFLITSGFWLLLFEGWFPTISDTVPSSTACIVLPLLGIGLRLTAIDRSLHTARQIDRQKEGVVERL
jgi:hypothetical protein